MFSVTAILWFVLCVVLELRNKINVRGCQPYCNIIVEISYVKREKYFSFFIPQ